MHQIQYNNPDVLNNVMKCHCRKLCGLSDDLGSMDRVRQVEAIHGYNNMKANLMEYLSKFADNKKVVREEDIKEFFQNMSNKKQRFN